MPCTRACVSPGQQMHVQDMVDETERLILRVVLLEDSYPGVPVWQATEFWSGSRAADELRAAMKMDARGRGCRPIGCGSLVRGRSDCASFGVGFGSNEEEWPMRALSLSRGLRQAQAT
jgi:hypothetical protein